jgi:molybdenum cofactor synthesis domain-containing protein
MTGVPFRCAVVTVSDRRSHGSATDTTGPRIAEWIASLGWYLAGTFTLPDEVGPLTDQLRELASHPVDLVLTTGGTGLSPRDVTPEATLAAGERIVPGIHEWIRASTGRTLPAAYLSRGVAVVRNRTLIVNLPGSPRAVEEYLLHLGQILPHALAQLRAEPGSRESDTHPESEQTP